MTTEQHAAITAPLYTALRSISSARRRFGANHTALDAAAACIHAKLDAAHAAAGV